MIRLVRPELLNVKPIASPLGYGNSFSAFSHRPVTELDKITCTQPLTVSDLQKSCGFSLESAVSASDKLRVDTTDKIDSVLKLLRTHGLTRSQINNFVTKRPSGDLGDTLEPNLKLFKSLGITGANLAEMLNKEHRVLESDAYATVEFFRTNGFSDSQIKSITVKRPKFYVYNLKKCMKPKLEFFKALGFAELQMAKFLSSQPYILERSLENHIIPCIEILRRVLDTDENVLKAIRAGCLVLEYNIEKVLEPNIAILVNHGVPKSLVVKLMLIQPRTLLQSTARLNKIIDEVKKLGFDPTNLLFVLAIRSMAVMSKALWEKKLEAYMNFGLTKDEVYSAFRRQPMFMIVSEQKISKLMDCYVNKLSMEPLIISKHPYLLLFSLEKRILPRCSVLQLLMSNKVITEDFSLTYMFKMTEKQFIERIVKKYEHKVPKVVKAHQGKIKFQGFLK